MSVLSPPEAVPAHGFAELSGLLRPYVDGLIVTVGRHQATFLPAVWHKLPDPTDFLAALLAKGGWHRDRLPAGARRAPVHGLRVPRRAPARAAPVGRTSVTG